MSKDDHTARGFAGLERLISEVDLAAIPRPRPKTSPSPPSPAKVAMSGVASVKPDRDRGPPAAWVIGGLIVVWILVASLQGNDHNSGSSLPVTPSVPTAVSTSSSSTELPQANAGGALSSGVGSISTPTNDVEESRPDDFASVRPYSANQIAYCLAQDARMEAVKPMVRATSHREVDHFNQLVSDFNARCSHYQYREEDMIRARDYVASHQDGVAKQAAHWLGLWRRGASRKLEFPTDQISSSTEP